MNNYGTPYVFEYYNNTYDYNAAMPVDVSVGLETSGIDFALELGGSISGEVTRDSDDQAVSGIQVLVWDYSTGTGFGSYQTLTDGTYTITGLPAGDYRLMVIASGTEYAGEYYDNVTDSNTATQVPVTAGSDTGGIDFSLGLGGSISGIVRGPDGSARFRHPGGRERIQYRNMVWRHSHLTRRFFHIRRFAARKL